MKNEYQGKIIFTESVIREIERSNLEVCRDWLHILLMHSPKTVDHLKFEVKGSLGLSEEVVERAGKALGLLECVVEGKRGWGLPYRGTLRP